MDEQIAQFAAVTGAPPDRARFFVESAGGDVEAAVATFYESGGEDATSAEAQSQAQEAAGTAETDTPPSDDAPSSGPRTLSGAAAEPLPAGWGSGAGSGSTSRRTDNSGAGRGGISTFRDLVRGESRRSGSDEDEEDDRRPENLFAGGERSGINVENPDFRKKGEEPESVQQILKHARENRPHSPESGPSAPSLPRFTGVGRTIGDEDASDSPQAGAQGGSSLSGGAEAESEEEDEVAIRHLTFWQDGFSVEDGELHPYDDPESKQLLEAIRNDRAPHSLFNITFGQRVEIRVAQRLGEKYQPPPPGPMKPFVGTGNRLGSPAPALASSSTSSAAVPPAPASHSQAQSASSLQIDDTKPVTQVQIRLGDGSRLVGRFNHEHTVADVRNYINASQPGMSARSYSLQSSFPPKPLADETQTLKDAGLVNAVVIQKWT